MSHSVMTRKRIWTTLKYELLTKELVQRFGAASKWEKAVSPGRNLDLKYNQFCENFALAIGARSGEAVKMQIGMILPTRGKWFGRHIAEGRYNNQLHLLAAAVKTGFIKPNDFTMTYTMK